MTTATFIGARIDFGFARIRYVINPENNDSKFSAGLTLPGRTYPWEKAQKSPLQR